MHTVYYLRATELSEEFLASLRALFNGRELEIIVTEVDETAYLLRTDANRQRLLQAIERVNTRQELVEVDLEALP